MRVCLVANNSLRVSPYVKKYATLLDRLNIEYDILSKEHIKEKSNLDNHKNIYFYKDASNPVGKFIRFVGYADYVKKRIKRGGYAKVVFFTGSNAAFSYLRFGRYMKKNIDYLLDIRDYDRSFTNKFIAGYLRKAVKNAEAVIISSEKFKKWLTETNTTYVMHNLPNDLSELENSNVFEGEKIRIGFFGSINYFQQNKYLLDKLKNKDRFLFVYRGVYPEQYNIKNYCENEKIGNVEFYGRYKDDEKNTLYKDIDIINAVYGNDSLIVTTALPNKLYDCVCYKIPMMVNSGTYLAEIVNKYSLGFSVSVDTEHLEDVIEDYIRNFDKNVFAIGCKKYLEVAVEEQKYTDSKIEEFFRKGI